MRILVVEDDDDIRDFIKMGLESELYVVDTASNGEQGSYIARTNEYDVIILDLSMPKKDGFAVCSDIRKNNNSVPIIILSVIFDPMTKIRLLNAGADDYVTKPFSFHELLARIRAVIRRPHVILPDFMEVGDITLDTLRQRVTKTGKVIYLTRKEFSLLEFLMRHPGIVISRSMIMEHVWNADTDPFSNTIEAHILNVRRKIDSNSSQKFIHTVPGRGYKFELVDTP